MPVSVEARPAPAKAMPVSDKARSAPAKATGVSHKQAAWPTGPGWRCPRAATTPPPPHFARNLSWSFFETPQKRCNSNNANSMIEQTTGELRAKLMGGGGACPGDQWAADVTNVVKPTRFKSPREDPCDKRRQSKPKNHHFQRKSPRIDDVRNNGSEIHTKNTLD